MLELSQKAIIKMEKNNRSSLLLRKFMASAQKTHYRHGLSFIKRVSNNVYASIKYLERNFSIKTTFHEGYIFFITLAFKLEFVSVLYNKRNTLDENLLL